MGLFLERARLQNFRNIEDRELELSDGMNILVGSNAIGKTNTLEALQLLTTGRSFRHPTAAQLVREGSDGGVINLSERGDGRFIDTSMTFSTDGRAYERNGKKIRPQDVAGDLISILFNPDDLTFAKGPGSLRRQELDEFGRQVNKGYGRLVSRYGHTVEQRNRLLKDDYPDRALLEAWNESLAIGSTKLLMHRLSLFSLLKDAFVNAYGTISSGEEVGVSYESSLGIPVMGLTEGDLLAAFRTKLTDMRDEEFRRRQTLVGAHLDDLVFSVEGRSARIFASQGQQRSVVLAWKMAEVEVSHHLSGSLPVLFLDDVMSELDATRREALATFAEKGLQIVVTTTNLGYFTPELLERAEVVCYEKQI